MTFELTNYDELIFEKIKHIDNDGNEFWYARELQEALNYSEWRNFENIIEKSKISSINAGNSSAINFVDVNKNVDVGLGKREIKDYRLSRYACYLIVQNGDPRKDIIALGQSYFAIKTRQQELNEQFNSLNENQKRIAIRKEIKHHNKSLNESARNAGVKNFGKFHNSGYQGLYGGLSVSDIREIKGLNSNEEILDYMGSTELAANLFRATQTDEKLRRENIIGEERANKTHFEVGKKVRKTMTELGNKPPEELPTPNKSIKQIEKEQEPNNDQLTLF